MRSDLSRAIYRQLINGKLINQLHLETGVPEANELYDEIIKNGQAYTELYHNIGYQLHQVGEAFMIRDIDVDDQFLDAAKKVQVVIDLLGKSLQLAAMMPEKLTDINAGLDTDELTAFDDHEEFNLILKACGMTGTLSDEVKKNLVARNIACMSSKGRLILTSGGAAFYDQLHQA